MRIHCVVFDLGGTLTAQLPAMPPELPWRRYAEALPASSEPDTVTRRLVEAELAVHQDCRIGQRSHTIHDILRMAEVPYAEPAIEAYRSAWDPYTVASPHAAAVLRTLRDAGLRIGLLSNTIWPRSWHIELLARDGLLELFDAAVFSTDLDVVKPHPAAFSHVLALLGAPSPATGVFVGDRLHEDISGAQSIGMRTVLITTESVAPAHILPSTAVPDHRISDIHELLSLLGHGLRRVPQAKSMFEAAGGN